MIARHKATCTPVPRLQITSLHPCSFFLSRGLLGSDASEEDACPRWCQYCLWQHCRQSQNMKRTHSTGTSSLRKRITQQKKRGLAELTVG